jgi:UDP-glucose 4-epimerase
MRILVTGGAGFIGSHVVDAYLKIGHEVGVVDDLSSGRQENVHPQAQFWRVDIRKDDLARVLAEFRPQVINHHAAQMSVAVSVMDPKRDADINVLGSLNLLEAAVRHGVQRIIFASTGGAVYGDLDLIPTPEDVAPQPVSPYGVAKLAVEHYLHAYFIMHGLQAIVLRYSNVYGPRQNPHGEAGVVAIFCQGILDDRELTVNGDGGQTRDYIHVSDVVRANILATETTATQMVPMLNIGTGLESSVNDILHLLRAVAGKPVRWRHGPPRPGEQRRSVLACRVAKDRLGWEATTHLQEGLAQTYQWFAGSWRAASREGAAARRLEP